MSSKRKTTTTNTHGFVTTPGSADIDALRTMKAQVDPTIPYRYGAAKEQMENSYNNPFGAATSNATRDAAARATSNGLNAAQAAETAGSQADADNANFSRQGTIAQMTAPQMVQTGGTQVQSTPFNWGSLLTAGLGAGGAALSGGGTAALM